MVTSALYQWYAVDNMEQYSRLAESNLVNVASTVETLDETIKSVGFLTVNDNDAVLMMSAGEMDLFLHGVLQKKLMNIVFTHPIIHSAYLVNAKANWIVGSPSVNTTSAKKYSDYIGGLIADKRQNAIVRINSHRADIGVGSSEKEDDLVSYVFFPTPNSVDGDSFLILNVQQSEIADSIEANISVPQTALVAIDATGRVILSPNHETLYSDYSSKGYVSEITGKGNSGYFEYEDEAGKYLVTYVHSEKLGYTFLYTIPYNIVQQSSMQLRNRTIMLAGLILVAGFAVAIILSFHFYSPLNHLVKKYAPNPGSNRQTGDNRFRDEYELLDNMLANNQQGAHTLEGFINDNLPMIKQDYLKKLLDGKVAIEIEREHLSELDIDLPFQWFRVIDCRVEFEDTVPEGLDLDSSVNKISELVMTEWEPDSKKEVFWDNYSRSLIVIVNYPNKPSNESGAVLSGEQLRSHINKHLRLDTFFAVGPCLQNALHRSYCTALELSQYSVKYGNQVITKDLVDKGIAGQNQYPKEIEKKLISGLRGLSIDECHQAAEELSKLFQSYSILDMQRALNHILYHTFQTVREMIAKNNIFGEVGYLYSYDKLIAFRSLNELKDNLCFFYDNIMADMKRALDTDDSSHSETVRRVMNYVKDNFKNPNISLESAAEDVNLSPSYLGKIFKESTGVSLTEYINRVRLDAAKMLLKSSSENVASIGNLVGFNSTTYFITCFKKYTGVTPAKYRQS